MTTVSTEETLYKRWVADRDLPSIGTNDGAEPLAFQRWHHFKEAFAPELIHRAISESQRRVERCLDPFGGSGTTALTCQMLGVASSTTEVNPFLADVIRAKLANYDPDNLVSQLENVQQRVSNNPQGTIPMDLPPTFVEPGLSDRWIYSESVIGAIYALLEAIDEITIVDRRAGQLFRVLVGGMLIELSNVSVTGKGRRYRRNWDTRKISADRVVATFVQRAKAAILEIAAFGARPAVACDVITGDSREVCLSADAYDLCVFSPPYPNSFDYTDVYNVQLWVLGYLRGYEDNRRLRQATLTSHVQVSREFAVKPGGSETLDAVLARLDASRQHLWDKNIPAMIGAYFSDLVGVTQSALQALRDQGELWMVVGDSKYKGVHVPVSMVLVELLDSNGHGPVQVEPIRHMKSSAQQGLTSDLAETLIRISKT